MTDNNPAIVWQLGACFSAANLSVVGLFASLKQSLLRWLLGENQWGICPQSPVIYLLGCHWLLVVVPLWGWGVKQSYLQSFYSIKDECEAFCAQVIQIKTFSDYLCIFNTALNALHVEHLTEGNYSFLHWILTRSFFAFLSMLQHKLNSTVCSWQNRHLFSSWWPP